MCLSACLQELNVGSILSGFLEDHVLSSCSGHFHVYSIQVFLRLLGPVKSHSHYLNLIAMILIQNLDSCDNEHFMILPRDEELLILERLRAGREEGESRWDGWMVSLTQWTWVWGNSRRQWRTRKPGVLQSLGLQRVRHDLATAQQQKLIYNIVLVLQNYNSVIYII